jgi:ribosomal protein L13
VRTYSPKPADADKQWYVIDATDVVLGRLAAQVAAILRGKHKPTFAPHLDMGDYVIIINADKVALTGKKLDQKMAYRHSGRPGGLSATRYRDLMAERPERAVEKAVRGMLPHTSLGRAQFKKLHVYAGAEHPHIGQQPIPYEITQVAQ